MHCYFLFVRKHLGIYNVVDVFIFLEPNEFLFIAQTHLK